MLTADPKKTARAAGLLKCLREFFGDRKAVRILATDLDKYVTYLREAGMAENTILNRLRVLGKTYRWKSAVRLRMNWCCQR